MEAKPFKFSLQESASIVASALTCMPCAGPANPAACDALVKQIEAIVQARLSEGR